MIQVEDLPAREIITGFSGRFVHGEQSTLAVWNITKGSQLPEHHHLHEQITYVLAGELEIILDGKVHLLRAGSALVIPSGALHSGIALQDTKVIDTFSPARDDYR